MERTFSHRRFLWSMATAAAVMVVFGLPGCGGGSSSSSTNSGGSTSGGGGGTSQASSSIVSGSLSDILGAPIVGATVQIGSLSTTSTQAGAFVIPNVVVASGQTSLVTRVTASATLNGTAYSGSNLVKVVAGVANTQNIHVVLSPTTQQGTLSGTVQDSSGKALTNAQVVAGVLDSTGNPFFSNLSSFVAITDSNGHYTIPNVPPTNATVGNVSYTVTALAIGHVNQVLTVAVPAGQSVTASFNLAPSTTGPSLAVVTNFSAQAITEPSSVSRGTVTSGGVNALRHFILAQRGLLGKASGSLQRVFVKAPTSRATPAGSFIESDLFWDYAAVSTLLGYSINRSAGNATSFQEVAVVLDPLASRYSEIDSALTPDTTYYYSVARVDTVNYPVTGNEGSPAEPLAVEPLAPLALLQPATKTSQSATPVFSWSPVNRAALYQILVYDRFPDYQSDTSTDGVPPIWPANPASPGTSVVKTTSQTYAGPQLQSGHTYYWAVVASDAAGADFSLSPIYSFTVQ